MFRSRIIHIAADHRGGNGTQRFDHSNRSMCLKRVNMESKEMKGEHTSTNASSAGTARSRIGCKMRSGSMTLIDLRQLWILATVVLS